MMISCTGMICGDDFDAAVRSEVGFFTFFAIIVSDVVGILLVELQKIIAIVSSSPGWELLRMYGALTFSLSISGFFRNSVLQNFMFSSKERPMPFRKSPNCSRPWCFMWWVCMIALWIFSMQGGNDCLLSWKGIAQVFNLLCINMHNHMTESMEERERVHAHKYSIAPTKPYISILYWFWNNFVPGNFSDSK